MIVPADYNFSGNGIAYGGERMPSPKMQASEISTIRISQSRSIQMTRLLLSIRIFSSNTDVYDCTCISLTLEGRQIADTKVDIASRTVDVSRLISFRRWRYLTYHGARKNPGWQQMPENIVVTVSFVT